MADICFRTKGSELENYIRGGDPGSWAAEHHVIFTNEKDAMAEAKRRLARWSKRRG